MADRNSYNENSLKNRDDSQNRSQNKSQNSSKDCGQLCSCGQDRKSSVII